MVEHRRCCNSHMQHFSGKQTLLQHSLSYPARSMRCATSRLCCLRSQVQRLCIQSCSRAKGLCIHSNVGTLNIFTKPPYFFLKTT